MARRLLCLLTTASLLAGGCGPSATPRTTSAQGSPSVAPAAATAAVRQFALRMNNQFSATDTHTQELARFIESVKQQTGGTVSIAMFPGGGLASSRDTAVAVSRGTIDIDVSGSLYYETLLPAMQIISAPFTGLTNEKVLEALAPRKEARELLDNQLAQKNLKILSIWAIGWPGIVSMEPLNTIESFRGKKIRMASVFVGADLLRKYGAEVVLMSGSEAVDALNRGLIHGSTTGPLGMLSRGYPSFAKYWQMWPVDAAPVLMTMNLGRFNELSPEQQAILVSIAEQTARNRNESILRQDIAALSESIARGVKHLAISEKDLRTLAAEARPLIEKFARETEPSDVSLRFLALLLGN